MSDPPDEKSAGPRTPGPTDDDEHEATGNGAVFGVLFAVALTIGALFLMTRMRDAAALLDCAFTHAPQCRAMVDDK